MDLKQMLEQYKNGEVEQAAVIEAVDALKADMVPRSRLNDKNAEIEELNAELEKRAQKITDLEKRADKDTELQQQLEDERQKNADFQEKYKQSQLNNAIKLAVAKDANDADDVLALLNKEGLELSEDGTVKGLEDAVNTLKESKPYLFTAVKPTGRTPREADNPKVSKEQILAIENPVERQAAIRENMNLFQ